jgi:hypothetical protein
MSLQDHVRSLNTRAKLLYDMGDIRGALGFLQRESMRTGPARGFIIKALVELTKRAAADGHRDIAVGTLETLRDDPRNVELRTHLQADLDSLG